MEDIQNASIILYDNSYGPQIYLPLSSPFQCLNA